MCILSQGGSQSDPNPHTNPESDSLAGAGADSYGSVSLPKSDLDAVIRAYRDRLWADATRERLRARSRFVRLGFLLGGHRRRVLARRDSRRAAETPVMIGGRIAWLPQSDWSL